MKRLLLKQNQLPSNIHFGVGMAYVDGAKYSLGPLLRDWLYARCMQSVYICIDPFNRTMEISE